MSGIVKAAAVAVALVLVISLVVLSRGGGDTRTATAFFNRTVGVFEGSDVRVLGVPVGKVTNIDPLGTSTRVTFTYDAKKAPAPEGAGVVIVTPTVVSDRYLQLTPVYTGGPKMADGAVIPLERTSEPVELDEIFGGITELNQALGPDGANKDGALNDLLQVSAANLDGNGEKINTALLEFSKFVRTLADNRDDLFGTIQNLQIFTTALARNDDAVRAFNADLAETADVLDDQKEDLALALESLGIALQDVTGFVADNRELLRSNIVGLTSATSALLVNRASLEEFLDVAPGALTNLQLAGNVPFGTLDTRQNMRGGGAGGSGVDPEAILCGIVEAAGVDCQIAQDLLSGQAPDRQAAIDTLNGVFPGLGDAVGNASGGGDGGGGDGGGGGLPQLPLGAAPAPGTAGPSSTAPAVPALPGSTQAGRDLTLGGILPVPGGQS